jgi:hypothetical protein
MVARWSTAAVIVAGAMFVGLVVWVMGLAGLANRAESVCRADVDDRRGYGAFQMSRELWPPSFECHLASNSLEPIDVQHPLEGIAVAGWVVAVPVVYVTATLVLAVRWAIGRAAPGDRTLGRS